MMTLERRPFAVPLLLLGLLALSGCATVDTGAHYDETNDFGAYETFSWVDDDPYVRDDGTRVSPLSQRKIEEAIRSELQRLGYTYVEDRNDADFAIAYTVGTRERIRPDHYPTHFRGPWGWHVPFSRYHVHEYRPHSYTRGTLGVDVFDGESGQPVWHGWAEKTITESDREDPSEAIRESVAKLFEEFPR